MKKDYTHITFVLDNSGSMSGVKAETIAGFNAFIKKQKEVAGECTVSLYQFNPETIPNPFSPKIAKPEEKHFIRGGNNCGNNYSGYDNSQIHVSTTYEFNHLNVVPDLNNENYKCDTYTPLLDTIGYAIDTTGQKLATLPEDQRPDTVIVVILTDGAENQSQAYTRDQINVKIKHQTDTFKWGFTFLGANQDAIAAGASIGIAAASSMSYSSSSTQATFDVMASNVVRGRTLAKKFDGSVTMDYMETERDEAIGKKDVKNV